MHSGSQKDDGENVFGGHLKCPIRTYVPTLANNINRNMNVCTKFHTNSFFGSWEDVLKDWPIRNFKVLWRQCLWRISTKETILVRELIGNITASLVSCSVFLKKKLEVWKVNKQLTNRLTTNWPFARWVKMKTNWHIFCQIISNFIRVRIFIFTRLGRPEYLFSLHRSKESW